MKTLIILVLIIVSFFSCSSSTIINTRPQRAWIYERYTGRWYPMSPVWLDVGGTRYMRVGMTPYKHSDCSPINSKTQFIFIKTGYKRAYLTLTRDEEYSREYCIYGACFFPILIWCKVYKPERTIELEKIEENK